MQRSEHPSGLFAGLAEIDPPFLWPGDGVGIALKVAAASRSPVSRSRPIPLARPVTFPESHALGKRMTGPCQRRFPVVPRYRQRHEAVAARADVLMGQLGDDVGLSEANPEHGCGGHRDPTAWLG